MKIKLLIALLAACAAPSLGQISSFAQQHSRQPLEFPSEVRSENGALTFDLYATTCNYTGPTTTFITRCYNGQLPGPTLYVYPGDTLTITLINNLGPEDPNDFLNFWQHLNYTNLHFHGGHVSASNGYDNVIPVVKPGESRTYTYHIPDFHEPGTAWYHPHVHGNAMLQVGAGMVGMIIIQDPVGYVPDVIANAPDLLLNLMHLPLGHLVLFGAQTCVSSSIFTPTTCGTETCVPQWSPEPGGGDILLVNGQIDPEVRIKAGVWYRARVLMSSVLFIIDMLASASSSDTAKQQACDFQLIAKDTIYLLDTPRQISSIYLFPGGRADVMIKCDIPGTIQAIGTNTPSDRIPKRHIANYVGNMFKIVIEPNPGVEPAGPLPIFKTQRPCYLVDTRSLLGSASVVKKPLIMDSCPAPSASAPANMHERRLSGMTNAPHVPLDTPYGGSAPLAFGLVQQGAIAAPTCEALANFPPLVHKCLNGCRFEQGVRGNVSFEGKYYFQDGVGETCKLVNSEAYLTTGTLVEWTALGIDNHPFHMHVNPYQLVDADFSFYEGMGGEQGFSNVTGQMFRVGDFGDSMMVPVKHATLHQQMDTFATRMVVHCHLLLHEDFGMIGAYEIQGQEGAVFEEAKTLDPTCYRSASERIGCVGCSYTHKDELSAGAIVGIILGVIVLTFIVCYYFFCMKGMTKARAPGRAASRKADGLQVVGVHEVSSTAP